MSTLEQEVRAALDAARGLTDASLKITFGGIDEVTTTEALTTALTVNKALMDVVVDLARVLDYVIEHIGLDPDPNAMQ